MGVNKLNSLMKNMANKAGLESQQLTNHSACKKMVQKLNDDVSPAHIMQLLGHKNIQSIDSYSHVSEQQQNILGGSSSTKPVVLECTSQNNKLILA